MVPTIARSYIRASTDEQDATRARAQVEVFAAEHGLTIAATYVENESGAKLARPELFRLLADSKPSDVLLIEQVDRLSRLTAGDWQRLRSELDARQVRVVAIDLPTSWMLAGPADEFTARMFAAVNGMMLDVLAAVARKDYDDRRRRQVQGQARRRPRGSTRAAPRTSLATTASPPCCAPALRGRRSRRRPGAAARQWRRSPSERHLPPETACEHPVGKPRRFSSSTPWRRSAFTRSGRSGPSRPPARRGHPRASPAYRRCRRVSRSRSARHRIGRAPPLRRELVP